MGKRTANDKGMTRAKAHELEALQLRQAGNSYDKIASKMKMTREGVRNCVKRAMAALSNEVNEAAADVLDLELQRIDVMLLGLWPKAKAGDPAAVDRVVRLMDRRAQYLGLDKAKRVALGGDPDGVPLSLEAAMAKILNGGGTPTTKAAPAAGGPDDPSAW